MPIPHEEAHRWVREGWRPLVKSLVADLRDLNPEFHIDQVKEKFGGLRFYAGGLTEEQERLVHKAESVSFTLCEECGEEGTSSDDGAFWIRTLCDTHRNERMGILERRRREALASQVARGLGG